MFELYETDDKKNLILLINGKKTNSHAMYVDDENNRYLWGELHEPEDFELLSNLSVQAIFNFFVKLSFIVKISDNLRFQLTLCNWKPYTEENELVRVNIIFCDSAEEWNKPYSMNQYSQALKRVTDQCESLSHFEGDGFNDDYIINGFGFEFEVPENIGTIKQLTEHAENTFNDLHQNIEKLIRLESGKITLEFNFPEHVSASCEQYLIYFSQFMADLGTEVNTGIDNTGNSTIFTVEPKNKEQALGVIRDALSSYLALPIQYESQGINKDISLMQLEANIYHLKSQLLLAQSLVESKNAHIEALQLSVRKYEELQAVDVNPETQNSDTDEESLIGNIVKVKPYKGMIFSIDTPRLLRNLKRKIKK